MDSIPWLKVIPPLLGLYGISKFFGFAILGGGVSKFASAVLTLASGILLCQNVLVGLAVGVVIFIVGELNFGCAVALQMHINRDHRRDSLRNILRQNLPGDFALSIFMALLAAAPCGYLASKQLQDKDKMPEWITSPTVLQLLGVIGVVFVFVWGSIIYRIIQTIHREGK